MEQRLVSVRVKGRGDESSRGKDGSGKVGTRVLSSGREEKAGRTTQDQRLSKTRWGIREQAKRER